MDAGESNAEIVAKTDTSKLTAPSAQPLTGDYYQITPLYDATTGLKVIDAVVPQGWSSSVSVDWNRVSCSYPGLATVSLASQNEKATIFYLSPQEFNEEVSVPAGYATHQNMEDTNAYITYLTYTNASQLGEVYLQNFGLTDFTLLETVTVPAEMQNAVSNLAKDYATTKYNVNAPAINNLPNCSYTLEAYEGTIAMQRWSVKNPSTGVTNYVETQCAVLADQYAINLSGSVFNAITWSVNYFSIFSAEDKTTFDNAHQQFEMFIANSVLNQDFMQTNIAYGSYIQNAINQKLVAQAMAQLKASEVLRDYGSDSPSTSSDDWAARWSDYIYDNNTYTTSDGSSFKASTSYDAVYQNGSDIYAGSAGNAPGDNWTQLSRQ